VYPLQLAYFLSKQLRVPGTDPPRERPLPMWVKAILGVQAILLIPLGLGLFLAPETVAAAWPWDLPPLSAQVVAAWCLAFGVLAAQSIFEDDERRVRCAMLGYPVLGAMHVLMLLRFSEDVAWEDPSAWVYVGVVASFFVLGAFGLIAESRTPSAARKGSSPGRRRTTSTDR
ncbi:MAG: hypothetical protein WD670_06440, partial [Actinomycetota bacterium]